MNDYGISTCTDGERRAITEMLELLLADGYSVEFRTQSSGVEGFGEYVVTVTNGDGDTEAGAEMDSLFSAMESVFDLLPTVDDFGTVAWRDKVAA